MAPQKQHNYAGMAAMVTAIAGLLTAVGGMYLGRSSEEKSQLTNESTYNVTMQQLIDVQKSVARLQGQMDMLMASRTGAAPRPPGSIGLGRPGTLGHGAGSGSGAGFGSGSETTVEVEVASPLSFEAIQNYVATKNLPVKSLKELRGEPQIEEAEAADTAAAAPPEDP